jgi:16S rRNA (cytosine967-C5)-methyltransferase
VKESLDRLGLRARLQVADARQTARWWDGKPFDAILLDAPCSASGIVRRHPDVRWLRRPQDITQMARTQDELLQALWPLLKPGGRLVYATCSVFLAEGRERIDAFLQRPEAGNALLDAASPGHLPPLLDHARVLPGAPVALPGDGFYYALLHRLP